MWRLGRVALENKQCGMVWWSGMKVDGVRSLCFWTCSIRKSTARKWNTLWRVFFHKAGRRPVEERYVLLVGVKPGQLVTLIRQARVEPWPWTGSGRAPGT